MLVTPFGMLPEVELYAFAWREDAQEWMRAHNINPLDLIDGSDRGSGHYIINTTDTTTCLIWFDIDACSFSVTEFAGVVASECLRLVRHVYSPFFSATTPCDDVLCPLLAQFTMHVLRECVFALRDALDVHGETGYAIPRDSFFLVVTEPTLHHVPSHWEMVQIYRDWQCGLAPVELEDRYAVDADLIASRVGFIRKTAKSLGLRTL